MSVNGKTIEYIPAENSRRNYGRRKAAFWAVTLSCFLPFIEDCKKKGIDAYKELKARFNKLLDALYRRCKNDNIAYLFWFKMVAYDGKHKFPHVHGVLFTECRKIKKIIAELWRKQGLGYQEFKSSRKRGNCMFADIYDLGGWVDYVDCFRNKYGAKGQRISYHGKKELKGLSIWRIEQYRRSGNLSIFAKQVRACL